MILGAREARREILVGSRYKADAGQAQDILHRMKSVQTRSGATGLKALNRIAVAAKLLSTNKDFAQGWADADLGGRPRRLRWGGGAISGSGTPPAAAGLPGTT